MVKVAKSEGDCDYILICRCSLLGKWNRQLLTAVFRCCANMFSQVFFFKFLINHVMHNHFFLKKLRFGMFVYMLGILENW